MSAMATTEQSPWMTPAEAARYLRIGPERLRRIVATGELKRYGTGKAARYRRQDLDEYLHNLT